MRVSASFETTESEWDGGVVLCPDDREAVEAQKEQATCSELPSSVVSQAVLLAFLHPKRACGDSSTGEQNRPWGGATCPPSALTQPCLPPYLNLLQVKEGAKRPGFQSTEVLNMAFRTGQAEFRPPLCSSFSMMSLCLPSLTFPICKMVI